MKYSKIIGTTAITLALGLAGQMAVAEMHGDHDGDKHMDDKKSSESIKSGSDLDERTDTGVGVEARHGSTGMDSEFPEDPDTGMDAEADEDN